MMISTKKPDIIITSFRYKQHFPRRLVAENVLHAVTLKYGYVLAVGGETLV